jgi:hypothetical protein
VDWKIRRKPPVVEYMGFMRRGNSFVIYEKVEKSGALKPYQGIIKPSNCCPHGVQFVAEKSTLRNDTQLKTPP